MKNAWGETRRKIGSMDYRVDVHRIMSRGVMFETT